MAFDFEHTKTIDSQTIPGVRFTITKPTVGGRAKLTMRASAHQKELNRLGAKFRALVIREAESAATTGNAHIDPSADAKEDKRLRFTDENLAGELLEDIRVIEQEKLNPIYVEWGLLNVEGLTIDGEPTFASQFLIDCGPENLVAEIADEIRMGLGLSSLMQKNSQPPTTSDEAAGGTPKSTTASTASSSDSIDSEHVHATPI